MKFLLIIFVSVLLVACSSPKYGCAENQGMVGYYPYKILKHK